MTDKPAYDSHDELLANLDIPSAPRSRNNVAEFVGVYGDELQHLDIDIEEVYDDRFVQTATGRELEKLAKFVGVRRNTGEVDDKFRKRILANFFALSSDTTFEDFARVVKDITDGDASEISILRPPDTPSAQVDILVDGAVLDDSPLTNTEIEGLLKEAVPAGHTVNLVERGTFAFASTEDDGLLGWNDGTWSSTVG